MSSSTKVPQNTTRDNTVGQAGRAGKKPCIFILVESNYITEVFEKYDDELGNTRLFCTSSEVDIYMVKRPVVSIAGRHNQIVHACLVAAQANGFSAGKLTMAKDMQLAPRLTKRAREAMARTASMFDNEPHNEDGE